jgi:hypothetical protein
LLFDISHDRWADPGTYMEKNNVGAADEGGCHIDGYSYFMDNSY